MASIHSLIDISFPNSNSLSISSTFDLSVNFAFKFNNNSMLKPNK